MTNSLALRAAAAVLIAAPLVLGSGGAAWAKPSDGSEASDRGRSDHSQGNASTTGEYDQPQPKSNADQNGTGANQSGPYDSTRDGSASGNGKGDDNGAQANGKPAAGTVGKADNKNPKGQEPGGSDGNAGYECDRNEGVGKTNPAHTGCTETAPAQPAPAQPAPAQPAPKPAPAKPGQGGGTEPAKPGNGTAAIVVDADCRTVSVSSSKDISNVVVRFVDGTSTKFDGLSGRTWTKTFGKDVASATAKSATTSVTGAATGCGTGPAPAPAPAPAPVGGNTGGGAGSQPCDGPMPGGSAGDSGTNCGHGGGAGSQPGGADGKVTICHATGSATNPFVVISPSKNAVVNGHAGHQDGRDVIPPFVYDDNGTARTFPGLNWGPAGFGACAAPLPLVPTLGGTVLPGTAAPGTAAPVSWPGECPVGMAPRRPFVGPVLPGGVDCVPVLIGGTDGGAGTAPVVPGATVPVAGPLGQGGVVSNSAAGGRVLGTTLSRTGASAPAGPAALPFTGAPLVALLAGGLALAGAGAGMVRAGRRSA